MFGSMPQSKWHVRKDGSLLLPLNNKGKRTYFTRKHSHCWKAAYFPKGVIAIQEGAGVPAKTDSIHSIRGISKEANMELLPL